MGAGVGDAGNEHVLLPTRGPGAAANAVPALLRVRHLRVAPLVDADDGVVGGDPLDGHQADRAIRAGRDPDYSPPDDQVTLRPRPTTPTRRRSSHEITWYRLARTG